MPGAGLAPTSLRLAARKDMDGGAKNRHDGTVCTHLNILCVSVVNFLLHST